ncbi:MAG: phage holin family protein [Actinomycetota bacterium]|nr:phage holin family protein [Actinomycetota bacterium]MDQ3464636.1 phage holin family protein [Actinomycetota bacterium]
MSSAQPEPLRPDVESRSVGDLLGELAGDLTKLMRQELELAKLEMKEEATKAGKAAGMLAGAGVAGHMALVFISLTVMWALGNVMNLAWAALIVTVLWAIAAAVLGSAGRKKLKQVNPKPEQTIDTLKEDAQWARTLNN